MLILLVWKPEAASAEGIESALVYFRARTRTGLARYTSACGVRGARFTQLLSVPARTRRRSSIFEDELRDDDNARHRDGIDAAGSSGADATPRTTLDGARSHVYNLTAI